MTSVGKQCGFQPEKRQNKSAALFFPLSLLSFTGSYASWWLATQILLYSFISWIGCAKSAQLFLLSINESECIYIYIKLDRKKTNSSDLVSRKRRSIPLLIQRCEKCKFLVCEISFL